MMDEFIKWLIDLFYDTEKKGGDGYLMLALTVPLDCLWKLYERLILVDVKPIETLPEEEKLKYWAIGKKYQPLEDKAIKASKAAYILSLITAS